MFIRLLLVILLAFALVGISGAPAIEAGPVVEVIDAESPSEAAEAAVARGLVAANPASSVIALVRSSAVGVRGSPELSRVFRPPRPPGS